MTGVAPAAVFAHHSRANYDMTKEIVVEGTVAALAWTNPHISMTLETQSPGGEQSRLEIELSSVSEALALGLKKEAIEPGARVVVRVHPGRSGPGAKAAGLDVRTSDGTVYPLAPGVAGGEHDPARHEFVNLDIHDVMADMEAFLEGLRAINPKVKAILTVSPVPLIATYEDRNVLVATTYSKSVLRVAADMLYRRYDWVEYFPSYEIIVGNYNNSAYFEADFRGINAIGVDHAMRCFIAHYTLAAATAGAAAETERHVQGIDGRGRGGVGTGRGLRRGSDRPGAPLTRAHAGDRAHRYVKLRAARIVGPRKTTNAG